MKRLEEIEGRLKAVEATALHKSRWQIEQENEVFGKNAPTDLRYLLDENARMKERAQAALECLETIGSEAAAGICLRQLLGDYSDTAGYFEEETR